MFTAKCKLYCKINSNKVYYKSDRTSLYFPFKKIFWDLQTDPIKLQKYIWFSLFSIGS